MTDKTQTIADPFADLLKDEPVCDCGTCREALDEALAEFQRYHEDPNKCFAWYVAHLSAGVMILSTLYSGLGAHQQAVIDRIGDDISSDPDALSYIIETYNAVVTKPEKVD
jgi:hypothetical protein